MSVQRYGGSTEVEASDPAKEYAMPQAAPVPKTRIKICDCQNTSSGILSMAFRHDSGKQHLASRDLAQVFPLVYPYSISFSPDSFLAIRLLHLHPLQPAVLFRGLSKSRQTSTHSRLESGATPATDRGSVKGGGR